MTVIQFSFNISLHLEWESKENKIQTFDITKCSSHKENYSQK